MVERMRKRVPNPREVIEWLQGEARRREDPGGVTPYEEQQYHERNGQPDALLASAEDRARHLVQRLHTEWLERRFENGTYMRSCCAAVRVITQREASKLALLDRLDETVAGNGADAVLGVLVQRAEALGRGDQEQRRRALAMVADAAAALRVGLGGPLHGGAER